MTTPNLLVGTNTENATRRPTFAEGFLGGHLRRENRGVTLPKATLTIRKEGGADD